MRADEFISEDQKLSEILPLILGAGRAAAGQLAKTAAKGAIAGAGKAIGRATSNQLGADNTDPNTVVGSQSAPNIKSSAIPATPSTNRPTVTPTTQNKAATSIPNITPGTNLQLPTGTGRVGNFKVSKVMGKDVEIENPDKNKNPNEPDKLVYNKDDLIKSLGLK